MLTFVISCLSLFLIWIIINSRFLPSLPNKAVLASQPLISVLVPMRNEELNAEALVRCFQSLTYSNVEFIILDDQSTDRTLPLLKQTISNDSRFTIISGKKLPTNWVGKVHACHQLQQNANGEYFLFVDADVRLNPSTLEKSLTLLQSKNAKLLTGFPAFEVPTFLSKLLIPMQHFVVLFHLPIGFANRTKRSATTAAHGGFMFFERVAYKKIGGHKSVHSSLVEDVHISRKMKEHGFYVLLTNITNEVSCRMYETNKDVWEGFLKNIYNGLGRSMPLVFALSLFYSLFYILPFLWLFYGLLSLQPLYLIPYTLITLHRVVVDYITNQRWTLCFLMPLSAIAFIAIMHTSMWKSLLKQSYQWKGRSYS